MNLDELKGNTNVQNMKSAIHKLEEKNTCFKCMVQDKTHNFVRD